MEIVILVIVLLIVIVLVGSLVSIYNSLIFLKNNISKAWSNIDVLLKQRHDELTKLMDSVKGYMNFERDVLIRVTQARSAYAQAKTIPEKAQADNMMTSALKSLFAVSENYPELKADEMFVQFQNRISEIESQIADRREFYNDSVNTFNIRIAQIPYVFIARLLNYTPQEFFKAADADKQDVAVRF
ncbi:MAG TPA: LemA family protein [Candidatus Acidoferrales bacterium]|nr:LemA family protein [Candidatus Acidoferrales bacterium]